MRSIGQAKDVTNGYWFGIASDQALADPKRNTALADLLVRFEKAARWARDNPEQWAQSYAAAVGLDPKVAEVSQGRSLRLPTELDDEVVASEQKMPTCSPTRVRSRPRQVRRLGRPPLQRRPRATC